MQAAPDANAPPAPATDAIALALAAIFAVHPANSEAVLWASDLSGLGATACLLAVVLLHASDAPRPRTALAIGVLTLTAALFKESGVLAPGLMALYDVLLRPRGGRRSMHALAYAGAIAALAAYFALRVHALGGSCRAPARSSSGRRSSRSTPSRCCRPMRPRSSGLSTSTCTETSRQVTYGDRSPFRLRCAARRERRRRRAGRTTSAAAPRVRRGLGWRSQWRRGCWFAGRSSTRSPSVTSTCRPSGSTSPWPRWPSPWLRLGRAAAACALLLVGGFVVRDAVRTRDWRDEVTIYTKTLEQSPRAELIRNNLALRYLDLGEPARGIPIQQELLRIAPSFPSGGTTSGCCCSPPDGATRRAMPSRNRRRSSLSTPPPR
jgi:hypothetical protein